MIDRDSVIRWLEHQAEMPYAPADHVNTAEAAISLIEGLEEELREARLDHKTRATPPAHRVRA